MMNPNSKFFRGGGKTYDFDFEEVPGPSPEPAEPALIEKKGKGKPAKPPKKKRRKLFRPFRFMMRMFFWGMIFGAGFLVGGLFEEEQVETIAEEIKFGTQESAFSTTQREIQTFGSPAIDGGQGQKRDFDTWQKELAKKIIESTEQSQNFAINSDIRINTELVPSIKNGEQMHCFPEESGIRFKERTAKWRLIHFKVPGHYKKFNTLLAYPEGTDTVYITSLFK